MSSVPRTPNHALAAVIVRLRAELGLSQDEVARVDGCSLGTIKNLEASNGDPRLSSMVGVAKGLGVPLVSLLREFASELEGSPSKDRVTSIRYPDDETVQILVRGSGLSLRLRMQKPREDVE